MVVAIITDTDRDCGFDTRKTWDQQSGPCKARIRLAGALAPSSVDLGNVTTGPFGFEGNDDHDTLREEVYNRTMDKWNRQY